jgi:hypothetical protein
MREHMKDRKRRPDGGGRGGVLNESLKFLSKLPTTVPKSILKGHTNKSYKTRDIKSQGNLEKFLGSLET